jgi:hypothetical protein
MVGNRNIRATIRAAMHKTDLFNVIFGSVIGGLGLVGAVFADKFKAGIVGPVFRPPIFTRIAVAIVFVCVGFSFIYSGLGSPARLTLLDNIARALLYVYLGLIAVFAVIEAGKSLLQSGKK